MNILRSKAIDLAYQYWPSLYKKRFFKKLNHLTQENIRQRNVEFEFLLLSKFLTPDSIFFDVGVNMGSYIYFAEKLIPSKNIFGFEPNPILYNRILHLFPTIHSSNLALNDTTEIMKFKVPSIGSKEFTGRGTLKTDFTEEDETSYKLLEVQTDTLDNYMEQNTIDRLDFLKVDVEGAELNVINGGISTIKNLAPVLLIEVEERHHNRKIWEVIQPILELSYIPFYLDRDTFELREFTSSTLTSQDITEISDKKSYLNNFIFLPK